MNLFRKLNQYYEQRHLVRAGWFLIFMSLILWTWSLGLAGLNSSPVEIGWSIYGLAQAFPYNLPWPLIWFTLPAVIGVGFLQRWNWAWWAFLIGFFSYGAWLFWMVVDVYYLHPL